MTQSEHLRKDVIRNRERLLATAEELAVEGGLALSFNTLAARAGVGVGTVYRHFAGSDTLLDALVERRVRRVARVLEQASTHEDPVEGLRAALLATGDLQAHDRGVWDAFADSPRRESARASLGPPTRRLVESAHASGRVADDFCLTDYVVMLWIANELTMLLGPVEPEAWRRYVGAMLAGFGVSTEADRRRSTTPALSVADFDRALDSLPHRVPRGHAARRGGPDGD